MQTWSEKRDLRSTLLRTSYNNDPYRIPSPLSLITLAVRGSWCIPTQCTSSWDTAQVDRSTLQHRPFF